MYCDFCHTEHYSHSGLPYEHGRRVAAARSRDRFEALVLRAAGYCEMCDRQLGVGRKTHADHCHVTGEDRGLLCNRCNTGPGLLGDNATALRRGLAYLELAAQ